MSDSPMERLEQALGRFKDDDVVPGGLLRVEDLRTVVSVAKDAKSWSDDVTRLVARIRELEAELAAESALGDMAEMSLATSHAIYAEGVEEAAERAREWTLLAVKQCLQENPVETSADELCAPARQLTAEQLLRPWTH